MKGVSMDRETIVKNFTYRRWTAEEIEKFQPLREMAKQYALRVFDLVPDCPEKEQAIIHLEETIYFVNAGISRYGG
jgi:hypothetical protein